MTTIPNPARAGIARTGRAHTTIDAPAEEIWAVVADVTRTGEWSGECYSVSWLGRAATPRPGARFRGRNRSGWMRWSRVCELITVDPPRELAWRTAGLLRRLDSTEWRLTLEPIGAGTRVVQSYQVVSLAPWLDRVYARLNPSHVDRTHELAADLDRLARIVEESTARPSRPTSGTSTPS